VRLDFGLLVHQDDTETDDNRHGERAL